MNQSNIEAVVKLLEALKGPSEQANPTDAAWRGVQSANSDLSQLMLTSLLSVIEAQERREEALFRRMLAFCDVAVARKRTSHVEPDAPNFNFDIFGAESGNNGPMNIPPERDTTVEREMAERYRSAEDVVE